jgi:uncharacterized membrane protein
MADDQVLPPTPPSELAPVETAQMPANEPLSGPIPSPASEPVSEPAPQTPASTPSESAPEPVPETPVNAPSEPAQPVSKAAETPIEPDVEVPESEQQPTQKAAAPAAPSANVNVPNKAERNRELLQRANIKRQDKKQKNLNTIITELEKRGKITNDEVEKILRCSDATATRYLATLVKQGKIQKVGTKGVGVAYTKI